MNELNELQREVMVLRADIEDAEKKFERRFRQLKNKDWRLFKKIDEKLNRKD